MAPSNDRRELRIFVGGTTAYADNRGLAAILCGTIALLSGVFQGNKLKISVWHTFPVLCPRFYKQIPTTKLEVNENTKVAIIGCSTKSFSNEKINIMVDILTIFGLFLTMVLVNAMNKIGIHFSPKTAVLKNLLSADLVIELNFGDAFTDVYYGKSVWFSSVLRLATLKLSEKPIYLFPQSIGPFKSAFSRALAHYLLKGTRIIAIREQFSETHLLEANITKSKIRFVPDTSLLLPQISSVEASKILKNEGFIRKSVGPSARAPLVGILFSPFLFSNYDSSKKGQVLREIVETIDSLIENHNINVVFIPHITTIDKQTFDCRNLSILIWSKLKNKNCAVVLKKEYTVEELWGVIGLCDLTISTLTHPVIASLKLGVPTIAISYSHKTRGVMNLYGMERYTILQNDFDGNELTKAVLELLESSSCIRGKLIEQTGTLEKVLMEFGHEISKLVHHSVS